MTTPTEKLTQFDYLLNAYTHAAQADKPAEHNYRAKREALYAHVRQLEADAALLRSQQPPVIKESLTTQQPGQDEPAMLLQCAYRLGFLRAAGWAKRDDLASDIGSPAYLRDQARDLTPVTARLSAPQAAGQWLPIETAPKGERALLWATRHGGHWFIDDWASYDRHNHPRITHWAPLPPAPPTPAGEGG